MVFVKWGSAMLCVRPTHDLKPNPSLFTVPLCVFKSMPGCWFLASLGGCWDGGGCQGSPCPTA